MTLLDTYLETLGGSDHTKSNCCIIARAFLQYNKIEDVEGLTKAAVQGYLAAMQSKTKNPLPRGKPASKGTVHTHFRTIARLYATNGVVWPFRRGEGPQVRERDQVRIMLGPRAVEGAIKAACVGAIGVREAAFLALSTTYGLRMGEIMNIRPEHLDYGRKTLWVETEKHGRDRSHSIPARIQQYLVDWDFDNSPSVSVMYQDWLTIEQAAGFTKHTSGVGWHSIRRKLVTMLWDVLPAPVISRYMRWSGEQREMVQRYHSIQELEVGETEMHYTADEGELAEDQRVFAVHPFLEMWK